MAQKNATNAVTATTLGVVSVVLIIASTFLIFHYTRPAQPPPQQVTSP